MNQKNKIVVGIVILLVVLLGGVFLTMNKSKSQTSTPSAKVGQPEMQKATTETAQGTLKSLVASGKSVKCSFSNSATDSAKVSGTVYVSSGKMRGDFKTTSNDSVSSHVIVDSQNSYIWTDMSKQGYKFAIANQQQTNAAGRSQGPDMNQTVDYSCQDWSVDGSVFALPTDITFTSPIMPAASSTTGGGSTGVSAQCAVCDNIPAGSGRDACKAQLRCP